jgi:hypothetical protein
VFLLMKEVAMLCKTVALSLLAIVLVCRPAHAEIKCPTDLNGDFIVNIDDLLGVINNWGTCPGLPCIADTNNDSLVNVDDLLAVINTWGECHLSFTLDVLPPPESAQSASSGKASRDGDASGGGGTDSNFYCIYQITAVGAQPPGTPAGTPQAVAVGQTICIHCPVALGLNACPNLANCKFKGNPGPPVNMNAVSGGVNAISLFPGTFCQHCPAAAGAFRYR